MLTAPTITSDDLNLDEVTDTCGCLHAWPWHPSMAICAQVLDGKPAAEVQQLQPWTGGLIPARTEQQQQQQQAPPGKAGVRLMLPSEGAEELALGSLTLETPAQHPMHKALRCRGFCNLGCLEPCCSVVPETSRPVLHAICFVCHGP
jgi:hypothetical protein